MRENKVKAMEAVQDIKDYIHEQIDLYIETMEYTYFNFDIFLGSMDKQFDDVFDKIDNL